MKRLLGIYLAALIASAGVLAPAGFAQAEKIPPYVVELAVFTCPHCRALQSQTRELEHMLGNRFVFAPLATKNGNNTAIRVYYALRDRRDESKIKAGLFELIQGLRMSPGSMGEVIEYLRLHGVELNPRNVARKAMSTKVSNAMQRAVNLAHAAGVSAVPAMVIVRDGRVAGVFQKSASESNADLVERVKKAIQE